VKLARIASAMRRDADPEGRLVRPPPDEAVAGERRRDDDQRQNDHGGTHPADDREARNVPDLGVT
jgi:hypothetical protein